MGNKIHKTTGIFDDVNHSKSRWVTYWAERIGLLVDHIIQVSHSAAFGAIPQNHMLFLEYFKIGCMSLDNFIIIWKVWSEAMLFTISRTVTSITAKKLSWAMATLILSKPLSWGQEAVPSVHMGTWNTQLHVQNARPVGCRKCCQEANYLRFDFRGNLTHFYAI